MFLLKIPNLSHWTWGEKCPTCIQIEKEIKVPWKMEMAVERETPWWDRRKRPWGKLSPLSTWHWYLSPFLLPLSSRRSAGSALLQKHLPSQWTGHIQQAMWCPGSTLVHDQRRNGGGKGKQWFLQFGCFQNAATVMTKWKDLILRVINRTTFHVKRIKSHSHP